jgi:tetratricopeptide (TPR) repeat protein
VYDLRKDAGQTKNLYSATDPLSASLARRFARYASDASKHAGAGTAATLTEEQRANLSSLGYFPGVPMGQGPPTLDPKDVIDIAERILDATQLERNGRFDEALAIVDGIVGKNPDNVRARAVRGEALLAQKRFREAAVTFGELVTLAPTIANYRTDLGSSLAGAGELEKAVTEWEKAIELEPHLADPRAKLIAARLQQGETAKALAMANESVAAGVESAELDVQLALAFATSGDLATAERYCEAALRLRPAYPKARALLEKIAEDRRRKDK